VQVHTAEHPDPRLNRLGSAVEPMTCPPDAFNWGRQLITLPIGGSTTVEWQITGSSGDLGENLEVASGTQKWPVGDARRTGNTGLCSGVTCCRGSGRPAELRLPLVGWSESGAAEAMEQPTSATRSR
jgi:hypothetical protein